MKSQKSRPENILIAVPVWRDKWACEKQFHLLLDAEVDLVTAVTGVENATFDTSRHLLEVAARTKRKEQEIRVLVHCNRMTSDILQFSEAEIEAFLAAFKGHEALGGYHIIDEPYDPNPFVRVERCIKRMDPEKIADINFLPGCAYPSLEEFAERIDDYLTRIGDDASYLSFDNYPFPAGEGAVSEINLFGNFEIIRKAGLKHNVPTAFYLQAVGGFHNSYRRPDEGTFRYHVSAALAYGFKWIKYWSWFVPDYGNPEETYNDYTDAIIGKDGEPTDLYAIAASVNKETHIVGRILAKADAVAVYHTGSRSVCDVYETVPQDFCIQPIGDVYAILSRLVRTDDGSVYLMIVNKDMVHRQEMHFTLNGIAAMKQVDKKHAGVLHDTQIQSGTLALTLSAGEYVLYKIETAPI